ncbi:FAD-dependent monooxygenase [Streptomyces sp. NPDC005423]|uniref:FAD-dependent monooxygenase n=1 Tax=Streptomyces sp. NPDC005423 TaxID=3155343 RepID=UPI0033B2A3AA
MTDDVLIVGAGPTGLTLACELARRDVSVRIVDALPAPHRHSRGKGLQPRTLEVLEDVGVTERVLAVGTTHLPFRKYFDGAYVNETEPFAGDGPAPDAPYESGVFIGQWQLEEILRERLAGLGVEVQRGCEAAELEQDPDGVTVTLTDGRRRRAGRLVGCDGGRSRIREAAGVRFDGTSEPAQTMVCGDVEAAGLSRDAWHQWFTSEGGAVMLCPLPGTGSFQFQASPELDAAGDPLPPSLESFQRLFDRHARLPGIRLSAPTWLSAWRVSVRMVDRMRAGRVFLAGDAAHVHPIAGGLGMNTGIQDAYNLGWKLALATAGRAGPGLLDTYEEERLPVAAWTLDVSSEATARVLDAAKRPGTGTEAAAVPPMGTGYRWSSLAGTPADAGDPGDPDGLRAGDRAPDAPCLDGAGRPVRLFQTYAHPGFTLLGFDSELARATKELGKRYGDDRGLRAFAVHDSGELRDHAGHARRAYGIDGPALVLIRPDNHVGLLTRNPADIDAYLTEHTR